MNNVIKSDTKAAVLIGSDPKMVNLCMELGIKLGFGDISVGQLCEHNGISVDLFVSFCKLMSSPSFIPDTTMLDDNDIAVILRFLERFHSEYRQSALPQLHANVHKIAEQCPREIKIVVNSFFDDFDAEMTRHMENEEKGQFSYIKGLLAGSVREGESLDSFIDLHDDVEVKLEDFKNILLKYVPENCDIAERYIAIIQAMHIADALHFHTKVEDRLLYPLASELEKRIR